VKDPLKALDHIAGVEGKAIFVLRDFHAYLDNPQVIRKLRDLAHDLPRKSQKNVILLSPVLKMPPELEKEVSVLDVIEAIEGPSDAGRCVLEDRPYLI